MGLFRGRFLDLRTLAGALTGEGHSLESACKAFGVQHGKVRAERHGVVTEDYLDYNRRDVQATWELYLAPLEEWHRHPFAEVPTPVEVERSPDAFLITRAYSPATIGKAYLRSMGIRPRLEHQPGFPKQFLGRSMVAYYGGRSECHIRRQIVPVTYLDVLSMYPTVCALMGCGPSSSLNAWRSRTQRARRRNCRSARPSMTCSILAFGHSSRSWPRWSPMAMSCRYGLSTRKAEATRWGSTS